MAFLTLIVKSAFRNRLRTMLTTLGVALAIVAFLFLRTFIAAWYAGVEGSAADRMITRNKISITEQLPIAYVAKVKNLQGVADLSFANWFGGVYKDERDFFAQMAVDSDSWYRLYPEFVVSPEELSAWKEDRTGAIVGDLLADKYGWKLGDRIVLRGTIYFGQFEFTLRGIYKGKEKRTDRQQMHFHWKYLDEKVPDRMKNQVGWIVTKVDGPGGEVAQAIDKTFVNSLAETRTESEKAFQLSFLSMSSMLLDAIQIVSFVVLGILILILGNTLAMATRERTSEYAAMRAIGFRPSHIVRLVVGEGFVVALAGVLFGLAMATPVLKVVGEIFQKYFGSFLGAFEPDVGSMSVAAVIALAAGILASTVPAWKASRMKIVDALRRVE